MNNLDRLEKRLSELYRLQGEKQMELIELERRIIAVDESISLYKKTHYVLARGDESFEWHMTECTYSDFYESINEALEVAKEYGEKSPVVYNLLGEKVA